MTHLACGFLSFEHDDTKLFLIAVKLSALFETQYQGLGVLDYMPSYLSRRK